MNNLNNVRDQFKALTQTVNGKPLVYLDSAATTLKPSVVVDRITQFYSFETANVHRGAHYLADLGTSHFESARNTVKNFLGAESSEEIIFTKGTTESINMIADCYGMNFLKENDEIVITELEHHANLVPWQNLALKKNLKLKYIPVLLSGELDLSQIDQIITSKTKLVSFTGCSNTMGTFPPVELIIKRAQEVGAVTVMDAAQVVAQKQINVRSLGVDFLAFSAHKLFGPFGFGVLYGKKELLEKMPPYQYGGNMIANVSYDKTSYNSLPYKFEAGTPHVEGAIGTETAINFFTALKYDQLFQHEQDLLKYATASLQTIPELKIFGEAKEKAPLISFNLSGAHHSDVGQILDKQGIAVRVGLHCTQPLLKKFGLTGTVRASFSIYNTREDVDKLVEGINKAKRMLL
jgi:cysteine desulfurase / selenocysteine lyase